MSEAQNQVGAEEKPAQAISTSAPAAAAEHNGKCCSFIDIKCGATTLMVLDICYLIGLIIFIAVVVLAAAVEHIADPCKALPLNEL